MPIPLMIGIAVAVILITVTVIRDRKPKIKPVTTGSTGGKKLPWPSKATWLVIWKVVRFILIWGVIVALLILWGWYLADKEMKRAEVEQRVASTLAQERARKPPTERAWVYETAEPSGFDGEYNHPSESEARLTEDSRETLSFTVFYDDLGKTESVIFLLDRTKDEGIWTKDNPKMSGRWKLLPKPFQNINGGYCIIWCADKNPNTWYNAQFRQR